jgi:hypothetical protein
VPITRAYAYIELGHHIAFPKQVRPRLMSPSLKHLIKQLLKIVAGVFGCVFNECSIRALNAITSRDGVFTIDVLQLTQQNQAVLLQATQGATTHCQTEANSMSTVDFMYNTVHYDRPFRALYAIDESNSEALALKFIITYQQQEW